MTTKTSTATTAPDYIERDTVSGALLPHVMVKHRDDLVPVIWESPLPGQLAQEPAGEWAPATDDEYQRYLDHYAGEDE